MCPRIGPLIMSFGRAVLKVAQTDWGEAKWPNIAQKRKNSRESNSACATSAWTWAVVILDEGDYNIRHRSRKKAPRLIPNAGPSLVYSG